VTFELRDVVAGYGDTTILRGASLVVPPSSVVALLGANGAGKTTLLKVASGLLPTRSGQILLDGEDVTHAPAHRLAAQGVCHIPEGRGIFRSLTVRENLSMNSPTGREAQDLQRSIEAFPILGERLDQIAGTLSGGQQQMLALARAYVADASIVLLDEVSMGLAPSIIDDIFEFLGRLAATGTSMLLVEQYVQRALEVADYVYILHRGTFSFVGEPSELDSEDVFAQYLGHAHSS
jgi:branched-chain amino acid transport system ATP-binding protein